MKKKHLKQDLKTQIKITNLYIKAFKRLSEVLDGIYEKKEKDNN